MADSVFRRRPQQQRSQARVEQILKAAAEVFWEVGYEAATTHEIARRANTAVGTLYRFFPNKLAIFHELEKRHRQGVEETHAVLMAPEFMQQSLADMVQKIVETYADYFEENVGHRVVYVHYYLSPELFVHFDDAVDYGFIRRFAAGLRMSNGALSIAKSELLAEVCHRSFNALLLSALRSEADHRALLYGELQQLMISYLRPHWQPDIGDRPTAQSQDQAFSQASSQAPSQAPSTSIEKQAAQYNFTPRQKLALAHVAAHGSLTIQTFESLCPGRSRRTLQRDLKQLIAKGLLQSEGNTTQLTYRLASHGSESKPAL